MLFRERPERVRFLAMAFPAHAMLTELKIDDHGLCDAGATILAHALHLLPRLRTLKLSNNPIGDAGFEALVSAIASQKLFRPKSMAADQLRDVARRPGATDTEIARLLSDAALFEATAAQKPKERDCATLDLTGCRHGVLGMRVLAAALQQDGASFAGLRTLALGGEKMDDEAVSALAAGLGEGGTLGCLQCLDLSCLSVALTYGQEHYTHRTAGCIAIADALRSGALPRLTELKLLGPFTAEDEGITSLLQARARSSRCATPQGALAMLGFVLRLHPLL